MDIDRVISGSYIVDDDWLFLAIDDELVELVRGFCLVYFFADILVCHHAANACEGLDVWAGLVDG